MVPGSRWGSLVVIEKIERGKETYLNICIKRRRGAVFKVRCDCGVILEARGDQLHSSAKRCCCTAGCPFSVHFIKHGRRFTPEYNCWRNMKRRCLRPHDKNYHHYGGRGITICPTWVDNFSKFYLDMGSRPSSKHSIDRIDVNKGYSKENCKWATKSEQMYNRRTVGPLTIENKRLRDILSRWGIDPETGEGVFERGLTG